MGYTHYFTQKQTVDALQWQNFREHMEQLYRHYLSERIPASQINERYSPVPVVLCEGNGESHLSPDTLFTAGKDMLWFNGDALYGFDYETFAVFRLMPQRDEFNSSRFESRNGESYGGYWRDCNTDGKPYDVFVVAALLLLHNLCPGCFSISSDGDAQDWQPVLDYVSGALPHLTLSLPGGICCAEMA